LGSEVDVTIPPNQDGSGQECQISIPGTRNLNHLFDRLDRMGRPYYLRATVVTDGEDLNPHDNTATKSYNRDFRAVPGIANVHGFYLENRGQQPLDVRWSIEATSTESDWGIATEPASGDVTTIPVRGSAQGQVRFDVPLGTLEGARGNFRVRAVDVGDGSIVYEDEWFVIYTSSPPTILDHDFTVKNNMVEVGVLATDRVVGVKEASGVSVEYSTDGGVTYSTRVAQYLDGDFFEPTSFKAELGPFAPGTTVAMSVAVTNGVGVVSRLPEATVAIPDEQ
jgi:hypothetical protein